MAANVVSQARRGKQSAGVSRTRATWEFIKSLAGAVLIYLVINTLFIAASRIPSGSTSHQLLGAACRFPSGSMIPTLLVGDWLFVNRAVYGPHIPFTNSHMPSISEPKRGDVVVFVSPYPAAEAAHGRDPTP